MVSPFSRPSQLFQGGCPIDPKLIRVRVAGVHTPGSVTPPPFRAHRPPQYRPPDEAPVCLPANRSCLPRTRPHPPHHHIARPATSRCLQSMGRATTARPPWLYHPPPPPPLPRENNRGAIGACGGWGGKYLNEQGERRPPPSRSHPQPGSLRSAARARRRRPAGQPHAPPPRSRPLGPRGSNGSLTHETVAPSPAGPPSAGPQPPSPAVATPRSPKRQSPAGPRRASIDPFVSKKR